MNEIFEARDACEQGTASEQQKELANHPVGSGAIESACRQCQCRFKRTGQFWTNVGDKALMCPETLWRNGRWEQFYPHADLQMPLLDDFLTRSRLTHLPRHIIQR
jgi:hypothetical protein